MKLTLEIPPEVFARIKTAAQADECLVEEMAEHWLFISSRTHEELEEIEDEMDLESVRRARENDDPPQRKTLDDLREAIAAQRRERYAEPIAA